MPAVDTQIDQDPPVQEEPQRSRRKTAKKQQRSAAGKKPSAAYYVGYVDDMESVESIMKKFAALEEVQKKTDEGSSAGDKSKSGMDDKALEEVFKQTSHYSVNQLTKDPEAAYLDEFDHLDNNDLRDLLHGEDVVNADDFFEEEDDMDNEKLDWEWGSKRKDGKTGVRGKGFDREALLRRYRIMQMQLQDHNGHAYTITKQIRIVDPSLPIFVRIPPQPLPLPWGKTLSWDLMPSSLPLSTGADDLPERCHVYEADIVEDNIGQTLKGYAFEGIYIDAPWLRKGQDPEAPESKNHIAITELANWKWIQQLVPFGFVFIWIEKEHIPLVFKTLENWGFVYVENLCWVRREPNGKFTTDDYEMLREAKSTLFIFRRPRKDRSATTPDVDLRHQRNSDVLFDFVPSKFGDSDRHPCCRKPDKIFDTIETLLPNGLAKEDKIESYKLLDLFTHDNAKREGWVHVYHTGFEDIEMDSKRISDGWNAEDALCDAVRLVTVEDDTE